MVKYFMSQYSDFIPDDNELICPACGSILTEDERAEGGWNCHCGDFIPDSMVINPYRGLSCQHKQNTDWR